MSRYGDRFKDDLYDDLEYQFSISGRNITEFLALMLELLAALVRDLTWKED